MLNVDNDDDDDDDDDIAGDFIDYPRKPRKPMTVSCFMSNQQLWFCASSSDIVAKRRKL